MKILREKIFGAIKRANKAAKRQHEINEYLKDHNGSVSSPRHNLSKIDKRFEKLNKMLDDDLASLGTKSKKDNSIEARALHQSRRDKNFNLFGPKDELAEKQKDLEEWGREKFMQSRKEDAAFAREQNEIQKSIYELDNQKEEKPFVPWEQRHKAEKEAAERKEQAAKKAAEDKAKREAEKAAAQERLQAKKERIATSKASVEKHKDQAKELRENNKLNVAARDAKRWIKKNPGKSAAIGLGAAALGTAGYAAYKHYKNKKKEEDGDSKKK